jgi:hypothetical protein
VLAILLSTLALAAAADPTPASPGASGAAAEPTKSAKRPELVCHNEKPTGSHMVERVCVTREDADKEEQAAQAAMNSINRRTKAAANPPK